jgi:methylated-DNA-[protein]-cysteine S-methyltransferase
MMTEAVSCDDVARQQERWVAGDRRQPPAPCEPDCGDCLDNGREYGRVSLALDGLRQMAPGASLARAALAEALKDAREAIYYDTLDTPVGPVLLAASERGLRAIDYLDHRQSDALTRGVRSPARLAAARSQLEEYFDGRRTAFDVPIDLRGVGEFGARVLRAAAEIPFGQVRSYGELAREIGVPGAARAVGNALGRNPIPIVIPCHRIVRGDGTLGGYSGGPGIKDRLLALEGTLHAT